MSGRVVGPAGESVAGARVYVSSYTHKNHAEPQVRATTGSDGRFRFTATAAEVRSGATVATVAPGFGPDWVELSQLATAGNGSVLLWDVSNRSGVANADGAR